MLQLQPDLLQSLINGLWRCWGQVEICSLLLIHLAAIVLAKYQLHGENFAVRSSHLITVQVAPRIIPPNQQNCNWHIDRLAAAP